MNVKPFILILASVAMLSACRECEDCSEYTGEDVDGNAQYLNPSVQKCGADAEDAKDETVTGLSGTVHPKWDCVPK